MPAHRAPGRVDIMDEAGTTEGAPAQEPSIEEILASIRRIISDDGEEAAAPEGGAADEPMAAAPEPEPVAQEEPEAMPAEQAMQVEDVLDLTERIDPEPAPPPPAPPKPTVRAVEPAPAFRGDFSDDDALVSHPIQEQTADVLSRLNPRSADRTDDPLPIPHRTLEEVVRELLRPMLREWLDTYLPGIVERAVDREMRRVSRRADELH
jgi:cell pole-organizing protein PopZ